MDTSKRRLAYLWEGFWFSPESARNLAAARIIFAAHAIWILLSRDLPALSALPRPFWILVPPSARVRHLIFPGHPSLEEFLQVLAVLALLGAVLGICPRACCFISGLLLYHLAPYETIIRRVDPFIRGFTISVLALLTLSFSRCGDALCLPLRGHRRTPELDPAGAYNWPLKLIQLFLCQVYLFSAYAKLYITGWRWISAADIRYWFLLFSQQDQVNVFKSLGPWIASHPSLCQIIPIGTLALEFGFMAVLFWRRGRIWLAPMIALLHLGILLCMNLTFLNVPQLLIFVNWEHLSTRLRHILGLAARPERVNASAYTGT